MQMSLMESWASTCGSFVWLLFSETMWYAALTSWGRNWTSVSISLILWIRFRSILWFSRSSDMHPKDGQSSTLTCRSLWPPSVPTLFPSARAPSDNGTPGQKWNSCLLTTLLARNLSCCCDMILDQSSTRKTGFVVTTAWVCSLSWWGGRKVRQLVALSPQSECRGRWVPILSHFLLLQSRTRPTLRRVGLPISPNLDTSRTCAGICFHSNSKSLQIDRIYDRSSW